MTKILLAEGSIYPDGSSPFEYTCGGCCVVTLSRVQTPVGRPLKEDLVRHPA